MFFWTIAAVALAADQIIKYLVQTHLIPWESLPIIPGILHLTYVRNPGAAFGMFANWTWVFVLVGLAVIGLLVFLYPRIANQGRLFQLALALEVGGATGNLIDRLRFGAVIDFIDFRVWPVFNIADMAIVTGAVLLAYTILKRPADESI
ncbi:MAG: signal peptidase II [Syntrophomonadaceae bacterium]|nr:signal peptidase II [Syntrophomonadaceae bacterium]